MKKPTCSNNLFVIALLLLSVQLFSQNLVPFSPRYDQAIKGDILQIGNSNVGIHVSDPYNGTNTNDQLDAAVFVDIDGDPSTFNSSTADLDVPNDVSCYRIVYAGLYWSAVVDGDTPISDIKFKVPGGSYVDITGTEIYYQNAANDRFSNTYAYYHDVTDMLTALANPEGTYGVANISSMVGPKPNSEGLSAGWSLFVVYEDPLLPSKYITSFDGFTKITSTINETFPVNGFKTIPTGPVRAKYAFSTIEGDRRWEGDYLLMNGTPISATNNAGTIIREEDNFFNSTSSIIDPITNTPEIMTTRLPDGSNTLGFDSGIINVPNAGNTLIANGATSATISLGSNLDIYYFYFNAFSIEIIAPNIVLTKIVEDELGNDIGGQIVDLGDELYYTIGFQNNGNDDATDLIIRDILPINIVFNYPADIEFLPPGVTVQSYDPLTRELIFSVDRDIVEENDPVSAIRFKVTVVSTCSLLVDACSNNIDNQAYSTYKGTINPDFVISDDPSFNTNTGCLLTPGATNFLADINDCTFEEEVILCGASVELTAGNGYDTHSWSTSPTGTPVIGTSQSITVTETGTYYVHNYAIAPCQDTDQVFEVVTFGANVTNPVIPYADEVVTCPNDGKELPNIYICGSNGARLIETGITDTTSMIWEKLDEGSCAAVTNQDCANEDSGCTWNEVATGANFMADTLGQYRLTLNYSGGCFNQFYFNIYTNLLEPTVTSRDIYCTVPGEIAVGGVSSGYEFSLDGTNYQSSNTFSVTTANLYTVYIRQVGVTPNPCIFTVPDVQIVDHDFSVSTIITQPLCHGEQGSVAIAANDARPQYFFSISQGGTLVNSVGPITQSDYTFSNLNAGTYTVDVSTEDGCVFSGDIEIIQPPLLVATSALTKPLTCTEGEITVYPVGGTPPYYYFVNSTTVFQSTPTIPVTAAGTFDIRVVDSNNCFAETSITVDQIDAPSFNIVKTDILCADGTDTGVIEVNVTNANGNSLEYSIDNGVTFSNSPIFAGLAAGNYDVVVQYTAGTDACVSAPQEIVIHTADPIDGTAVVTAPYTCTTTGVITVSGVTGGTAPYTYSIDGVNFQNGTTFSGLTDGTYNVSIRDAINCTFIAAPVTISSLTPPTDLTFASTPLSCPLIVSDVTLTTVGGFGTLAYEIMAPASAVSNISGAANGVFTGLVPNTYTFQVTDANNCVYTESYTIAPLPPVAFSTVITKDLDCTISPDAVITGSITSGTAPFTYAVSFNGAPYGTAVSTGLTFTYSASNSGTYQIQITDNNGCTAESIIQTLSDPVTVTATNTSTNPTCNGDNDGSVTLTALTGQAPFTYSIDGGSTFVSSNVFGGLIAGNYNYVVRDSKACEATGSVSLVNPQPISVSIIRNPVDCSSGTGGSLDVSITSGGVAPFVYSLYDNTYTQIGSSVSTSSTTNTFSGLVFGDYYVTIIDSNGCEFRSSEQRIDTPPNIQLDGTATTGLCTTGATVDISVLSGTGPFTFSIYGQPSTAFTAALGVTTHTFTALDHGVTYQFQVEDAGGCFSIIEETTPVLSNIVIDPITATNVNCSGNNDGTVSFTVSDYDASVSSIYYEVRDELTNNPITPAQNGTFTGLSGASASTTISGLSAGNYTLFVEEADGTLCTASRIFQITQPIQPLLSVVASNNNANCNVGAQITLTTTGGTGPYMYAVGTSGFTPASGDFGSSNVLNLNYATRTNWDIVVRDANGCEFRINEDIDIDPEPVITATVNNQCTVTEGNFTIDVALTAAGIMPYTYSVDGGAFQTRTAPFTITNLNSGTHTVQVQDTNGCGNLVSVDIQAPLNITPTLTTLPTCNDNDGVITITETGGSGSYTYSISPSPATAILNVNEYSGLPSGTYTVTITDALTSCTMDATIVVPSPSAPVVSTTSMPITCLSDNNGTIDINVTGYSGTYNYEVFNSLGTSVTTGSGNTSVNPQQVTGLLADNYSVVVTETASPFCSATSNIIVGSPSEVLMVDAIETASVTCDNDGGTIVAIANGGWGSYQYELTGSALVAYSSNGTFSGLTAGNYTVNVLDAGGCIASDNVTLILPTITDGNITASTNTLTCFGDTNASITANVISGGQGSNYTYTLNQILPTVSSSGPQTSPIFNGLGAGTYSVTIADGYNCDATTARVTISEPTPIEATLVKAVSQTCFSTTTLTLSATGGTGTYSYSDSPAFTSVLGSLNPSTTITVSAGTYMYYVRDANGCISTVSNEIKIDPLPPLTVVIDKTNATINCAGDSSGVIVAQAQGGLGNYIYVLQDGTGTNITPAPVQTTAGVFTDLPVGMYQVSVSSGLDCEEVSEVITITEPDQPLMASPTVNDVTCNGGDDGVMEITASGGTGIIKYAISPQLNQFFESPIFSDLMAGTYQAIAQDELGCFVTFDFTIKEPSAVLLTIVPNSMVPEICSGDLDGAFSIEVSGGTLPYSVSLDDISGTYITGDVAQTIFDFDNLDGGDHIVYVRDNEGCESEWNITFPPSVLLDPQVEVEFGCVDNLATNTVTVTLDPSISDSSDVDYSLNNGPYQTSNVFNDVVAGLGHSITVRHTNGCEKTTLSFDVNEIEPLELELSDQENINEIVAIASGGTAPYEFTLNGESYGEENTFIIYASGDYVITVTDANGCVASVTGYFEYIDVCIPNYFTPESEEWGPGCSDQYKDLTVDIFDRYGRKIATVDVDTKWDGTYRGAELPTGDYWYLVKLNDPKDNRDFVGHFTLYR
ncbi:T9SS type B sorting domain-containing protein [uncultured Algibacter sp.]|uniref:T9SS type B sorting domain-containing protein n=1 Tax=uncultured Algibacter sp. TaxID=298659 RepID=UPI00262BD32E|nr:T9SS type B sorting domain-containing protein [uncultured Algibacter sp.]